MRWQRHESAGGRADPALARRRVVLACFALAGLALAGRAVFLQVLNTDFLRRQGEARHLRVVSVPAHRGMIMDRNGEPLAISTPVDSVWADPGALPADRRALARLAQALGMPAERLVRRIAARREREFVYLRRHVDPATAARVMALGLPGVHLQREYRRYYPMGEVAAHVVGFTNIDDVGQEGVELGWDRWLRGEPGAKRVLKDRLGRVVRDVALLRPARPGRDLRLALDRRLQYLAYRELKAAVLRHRARGGSIVVLDARTGEVLAMANQPAYNPNRRDRGPRTARRNRAVTDVFEPGSTMKPFTVAAALESGRFRPDTPVDTRPGLLRVADATVRDIRNFGLLDVTEVVRRSSNVGAAKIALALPARRLWSVYARLGFGRATASGFPGEADGVLLDHRRWHVVEQATAAFGYGLSVTALQLARAYAALAADGRLPQVSFPRRAGNAGSERVLPARVARQVRAMLEGVVGPGGTGRRAAVPGYRVAGKTGTVRKAGPGGYSDTRYVALFAGMAPASRPRLVAVVVIDEPRAGAYYGGEVAAPVFARVMAGALRLLDVPPDAPRGPMHVALGAEAAT